MGLVRLFTSFHGRITRRAFWFGLIALMAVSSAIAGPGVYSLLTDAEGTVSQIFSGTGLLALIVIFVPAMALTVKRLHDRGKSGLTAALFYAPAALTLADAALGGGYIAQITEWLSWILGIQMAAVGAWFFAELGFRGSERGPNAYGAQPGTDAAAGPAAA